MSVSNYQKELSFTDSVGIPFIVNARGILNNHYQDSCAFMYIAPTGKGKSFFVKNEFANFCRDCGHSILYLVPRKALKEEFEKEIVQSGQDDIITVMTYQHFESGLQFVPNDKYDIIICDECHYFVSDSLFNCNTEKSYKWVMNNNHDKLKIFLTATPQPIQQIIIEDMKKRNGHLMITELEGVSPINKVEFFSVLYEDIKRRNVEKILRLSDNFEIQGGSNLLDEVPEDEKTIVFCDSVRYAHDLYKKYESQSVFICSKDSPKNKKYLKDVADDAIFSKMLTEHKFDCKYLFCTSALDVGISFRDRQIKRIICLLHDWNSITQAIGRKRMIDKDDTVTLHLPYYNNQGIGGLMVQLENKFEHYYYLKEYGAEAYLQKYQKCYDPAKIVYYRDMGGGLSIPDVDKFVLANYQHQKHCLLAINAINSPNKYQDWVTQQLGLPSIKERLVSVLQAYAESERCFSKNDKNELVEAIGLHDTHNSSRLVKNISKINEYLESMKMDYRITSKRDNDKSRTTIYQVTKIV